MGQEQDHVLSLITKFILIRILSLGASYDALCGDTKDFTIQMRINQVTIVLLKNKNKNKKQSAKKYYDLANMVSVFLFSIFFNTIIIFF